MHRHRPHPPTPASPQRSGAAKRLFLVCTALVALLALAACGVSGADKAANAFMTDLKTANYAAAYALTTPTLQQKFGGSAQAMEGQVKKFGQQPSEWSFNSINVTGEVARLHGSATFTGAHKGAVDMELVDQGGTWSIASVSFAK